MKPLDWHGPSFAALLSEKTRLPHALLLRGPRGIGKMAFAQALSQALLCEEPADGAYACGTCTACVWFESASHPDYREIEPLGATERINEEEDDRKASDKKATSISVDQIRMLPEFINISSHRGGPKVIVIHPAETLNINAGNALLKNLEEPPPRTHFMLVTHRPQQLLPTIKSRCSQIALATPDSTVAAAWLGQKGVRTPDLALAHAGGAPLLAAELSNSDYWQTRAAFMRHLTARDFDALAAAEAVRDLPLPHVVSWLQKWSYDLAYYRSVGQVRYNPDHLEAIARTALHVDPLVTLRFHREMVKTQRIVHHPLNARLFIEQLLLAYGDVVQPRGVPA
jgi:DNA polymerase-3 subunit delta'